MLGVCWGMVVWDGQHAARRAGTVRLDPSLTHNLPISHLLCLCQLVFMALCSLHTDFTIHSRDKNGSSGPPGDVYPYFAGWVQGGSKDFPFVKGKCKRKLLEASYELEARQSKATD